MWFKKKQNKLTYYTVLNLLDRKSIDYGLGMYGLIVGNTCLIDIDEQLSRALFAYYVSNFPTKIIDEIWFKGWKIHIVDKDCGEKGYIMDNITKQFVVYK